MKTIIAGGRYYRFTREDTDRLSALAVKIGITEVVSGGAGGADLCGEVWAHTSGIDVTIFEAEWTKYDKAAGPIRNRKMAKYADAVILFPGDTGTLRMKEIARELGLAVYVR